VNAPSALVQTVREQGVSGLGVALARGAWHTVEDTGEAFGDIAYEATHYSGERSGDVIASRSVDALLGVADIVTTMKGAANGAARLTGAAEKLGEVPKAGASATGGARPTIHIGKQGKHVPGHNNFQPGRSELTHPEPQKLLDRGTVTGARHGTKEVVDFGEEIGVHFDQGGIRTPTTRGTIHYDSQGGAHIVPAKPEP
jgi:Bacterial toxin 50